MGSSSHPKAEAICVNVNVAGCHVLDKDHAYSAEVPGFRSRTGHFLKWLGFTRVRE